jgi:signal transduction histidine kinase
MVKKMRLKFFFVTSAIVVVMIIIFCGTIIITTKVRNNNEAQNSLDRIVNMFENFSGEAGENVRLQMNDVRSFAVILDLQDPNIFVRKPEVSYYTDDEIKAYIKQIRDGKIPKYFLVETRTLPIGELIAWVDRTTEIKDFNSMTLTVCLVGVGGILVLLVLVWFLSFWIVRPAVQSLEKQKRFISEASHELRTPLTIISAGVELLQKQNKNGESKKWLDDIKQQAEKMTAMTADLLALSRLEEVEIEKAEFDLSQTILKEVLSFESVAFEQGKEIDCDIQEGIIYKGNPKDLRQAVAILCDNAIKHSDKKAFIKVVLKQQNARNTLTVINTGGELTESELPFIFERFYRGSESRSNTQGTGLGLTILKTLAEQNDWKIDTKLNHDKIVFSITF